MVARMRRSISATPEGLERLEKIRSMSSKTAETIAGLAEVSRSLVQNFFGGKPIAVENFQKLCNVFELDWREIAGLQNEAPIERRKRAVFVINGSLDKLNATQVAKIQAMVQTLQNLTGDASLVVVDIEEGSIRLILEGSEDGIERLQQLFEEGALVDVLEIPVVEVSETSGIAVEPEEDYLKALLVEIIKSQGAVGASLTGAYLRSANLSGANLIGANLSGADLSSANLSHANFSGADLSGANLSHANLSFTQIDGTTVIDGKWRLIWEIVNQPEQGRHLSGADLSGADLSGADLQVADLNGAKLRWAILSGAKLRWAILSDADLIGADLIGADLSGANLSGANLSGARLRSANLSGANVRHTCFGQGLGLLKTEKLDLSQRGAIFDDALGDRSPTFSPSPFRR